MDFPLMDLRAVFAFDPAVIDPILADPTLTTTAGDGSGPDERLPAPHQNAPQPSDADTMSKLGVCSSCRR
jgi:hypothetical protein